MNIIKITDENFEEEVLKSDKLVLVDFYADWCGPCRALAPTIEKLSEEVQDIVVGKINVDDNQETTIKYEITSIPTIIIFKQGEVQREIVGMRDLQELKEIIEKIK